MATLVLAVIGGLTLTSRKAPFSAGERVGKPMLFGSVSGSTIKPPMTAGRSLEVIGR